MTGAAVVEVENLGHLQKIMKAVRRVKANPKELDDLVDTLRVNPHTPIDNVQQDMLVHRKIDLANEQKRLADKVLKAESPDEKSAAKFALYAAEDQYREILQMGEDVGTTTARSLANRKKWIDTLTYDLAHMKATEEIARGRSLTEAERGQIETLQKKMEENAAKKTKELEDAHEKIAELHAQLDHAEKAKAKPAPTEKPKGWGSKNTGVTLEDYAKAKAEAMSQLHSIGNLIPAALKVAAFHVEAGARSLADFTSKMVADLGEKIRPHLDELHAKAIAMVGKAGRESIMKGVKAKMDEGGPALSRYISELHRSFVEEALANGGKSTYEKSLDQVHDAIKDIVPEGWTKADTRDAMSGYGQFTTPSADEISSQIRAEKSELQEVSKLEGLAQTPPEAPRKTGPQRDKPSDTKRQLTQQVKDKMRQLGIRTTDPETQLAGVLDGIKTRLKNEIADMDLQMEQGKRTLAGERSSVAYDAEAKDLKAQRDAKKAEFDELFPKETSKADEKRTQDGIQRSIDAINEKLNNPNAKVPGDKQGADTKETADIRAHRDALQEKLDARRKAERDTASAAKKADPAEQLKTALKLAESGERQAVKALTDAQANGFKKPNGQKLTSPEIEAVKARAAAARAQTKALRDIDSGMAEDKQVTALSNQLKHLLAAPKPKDTPTTTADSKAVADLKAQIEAVKAAKNPARKTPEEIALSVAIAAKTRKITEYFDKMVRGDYAKVTRPKPHAPSDPGVVRLAAIERSLKDEWKKRQANIALANRNKFKVFTDSVGETLNLARAIMTSVDLSAVLLQGGMQTLSHPIRAAKAFVPMLKSFVSEHAQLLSDTEIHSRPNAGKYKEAGLDLTKVADNAHSEESYGSRWVHKKLPGGNLNPINLALGMVRGSERSYTTFLNRMRADGFDAMTATLGKSGAKMTGDELKAIAGFINASTGRGRLPGKADLAMGTLNKVFFSPRNLVSRFQIIVGQPMYGGSRRTQKLIAAEYARFAIGAAVVMGFGKLMGATIETDSRSSDFMKLKFGNTRINPWTGLQQIVVLGSRVASGSTVSVNGNERVLRGEGKKFGSENAGDVMGRFIRTKFNPILGAGVDLASGENVVGQKATVGSTLTQLATPMAIKDVAKAIEDQGVAKGSAIGIAAMLGMGMQSFDPNRTKDDVLKDPRILKKQNDEREHTKIREHLSDRVKALVHERGGLQQIPMTERTPAERNRLMKLHGFHTVYEKNLPLIYKGDADAIKRVEDRAKEVSQ